MNDSTNKCHKCKHHNEIKETLKTKKWDWMYCFAVFDWKIIKFCFLFTHITMRKKYVYLFNVEQIQLQYGAVVFLVLKILYRRHCLYKNIDNQVYTWYVQLSTHTNTHACSTVSVCVCMCVCVLCMTRTGKKFIMFFCCDVCFVCQKHIENKVKFHGKFLIIALKSGKLWLD